MQRFFFFLYRKNLHTKSASASCPMLYTRNNAHTPRCRKRLALHGGRKEERTGMGEGKERKRGEETCSLKGGECEVRVKKQEHKVSNGGEYSRECKRTKQGQLFYPFHDVTRVISRYKCIYVFIIRISLEGRTIRREREEKKHRSKLKEIQ